MSQKQKLLEKTRNAPKNTTFEEVSSLMRHFGFEPRKTSHGYMITHKELINKTMPHVPRPHGREGKVRVVYVRECLKAIELLKTKAEGKEKE